MLFISLYWRFWQRVGTNYCFLCLSMKIKHLIGNINSFISSEGRRMSAPLRLKTDSRNRNIDHFNVSKNVNHLLLEEQQG